MATMRNVDIVSCKKFAIRVAPRSKAWAVFSRSNVEVVGSTRTQGMGVCVYSVFVLFCV
jgi:hypothetical protein